MRQITPVKTEALALSEYLPYGMEVADGVMLCKDGGFLVGYSVESVDFVSLSANYQDYLLTRIRSALNILDDGGWCVYFDYIRERAEPLNASKFPDLVSNEIERLRVEKFNQPDFSFVSEITICLRWSPPDTVEHKLIDTFKNVVSLFSKRKGGEASKADEKLDSRLNAFLSVLNVFEDTAGSALSLERLVPIKDGDGRLISTLVSHLHHCLWGERQYLACYPHGIYTDVQLCTGNVWFGTNPVIGDSTVQVISIDNFPNETDTGLLISVGQLPFPFRWSTRFMLLSHERAENVMKQYRMKWQQQGRSLVDQFQGRNPMDARQVESIQAVGDIDEAKLETDRLNVAHGYYSAVLVLRDDDLEQLEERARMVRSQILRLGCSARIEKENASEAFLGSLPGDDIHNIRRPLLHTGHFCNLVPFSSTWEGEPYCPSNLIEGGTAPPLACVSGLGHTRFHFNLHDGDVGHSLVFGRTGSGKSVLLAFIAASFRRYRDARVVIFDKGQSLRALTYGVGGDWFELGLDTPHGFAPAESLAEPEEELSDFDSAWLETWLEALCQMNLREATFTTLHSKRLSDAIQRLSAAGQARTLTDIRTAIQDPQLQDALNKYHGNGAYAKLFDAERDDALLTPVSDWVCYETDNLMQLSQEAALPLLLYLFHMIERGATGRPTLILLDEAWALLDHPVFQGKIREWLKTMRKKNVAVVMATQSPVDITRSAIADALSESCPTRITAGNPDALQSSEPYQRLGFTQSDIESIALLTLKREYLLARHTQRKVFQLHLDRYALRWLGLADPASIKEMLSLIEQYPEEWREKHVEV